MRYVPLHSKRHRYYPRHAKPSDRKIKFGLWLDSRTPNRVARQEMKFRDHDIKMGGS